MTTKPLKFLQYSVATESRPRHPNQGQYCVTAEYVEGFQVLSYHQTEAEARAALKRYEAADKRRAR
jgi:hypothetical protein